MTPTSGEQELEARRKAKEVIIEDPTVCHACQSTGLNPDDKYCPNCRFPMGGDQNEMRYFMHKKSRIPKELADLTKRLVHGRIALVILAVLSVGLGLFLNNQGGEAIVGYTMIGLAVIYVGMALWSTRRPFAAFLVALILYISLQILSGILEPETLYKGWIWKAIFIGVLIYAVTGAQKIKEFEEKAEIFANPKQY